MGNSKAATTTLPTYLNEALAQFANFRFPLIPFRLIDTDFPSRLCPFIAAPPPPPLTHCSPGYPASARDECCCCGVSGATFCGFPRVVSPIRAQYRVQSTLLYTTMAAIGPVLVWDLVSTQSPEADAYGLESDWMVETRPLGTPGTTQSHVTVVRGS